MLAPQTRTYAKIRVVGVGGGGQNAVNRMIHAGVEGVEFLTVNTDSQALDVSLAPQKLQIGAEITKGLGAGGDPEAGRLSAEESKEEIRRALDGCEMVFVTCGMGGGTGTGASPVIAEIARSLGALTVGVVTRPFAYEGTRRSRQADEGIAAMRQFVDALIVIPNDRLFQIAERKTTLEDSFRSADDILRQGVEGISSVVVETGLINLDFADIRTVLANSGTTLMGIGVGSGEDRAVEAAKHAISSPLLETTIEGARRILINIKGGKDLTLQEVHEAAQAISEAAGTDPEDVYFGAVVSESIGDELRVTVIATGFEREQPASTPSIVGRTARETAAYEIGAGRPGQRAGAGGAQPPRTPIRPGESAVAPAAASDSSNVRPVGPGVAAPGAVPPPRVVPVDPRPTAPPQREDELEVPTFLRKRKQ